MAASTYMVVPFSSFAETSYVPEILSEIRF